MKTMLRLVACLAVLAGTVVWAETLNNDGVIQLHKLGLGDSVIVEKIKGSTCQFDTSVATLKSLKDARPVGRDHFGDDRHRQSTPPALPPRLRAIQMIRTQRTRRVSGLYQQVDGKPQMTQMRASPIDEIKSGGGFGVAWGGSAKSRAVISGAHASTQLAESQPVFYFYFDKSEEGLSSVGSFATSPDDFKLASLEIRKEKDERRLEIGKFTMGGSSIGLNKKDVQALNVDKVADRVYKVSPAIL